MANILEPAGAILVGLSIWLYACDRSNEFMPWVLVVGGVLLAAGAVFC